MTANNSKIEWTDTTWNPLTGCSIVSDGCKNCYAMQMSQRLAKMGKEKYQGVTRISGGRAVWTGKINLSPETLEDPYRWSKPRNVFVNSMSDLFHPDVPDDFIKQVWKVMKETSKHNYQVLTKRPERMVDFVHGIIGEVLPNVWLGTSVEDANTVSRIDDLRVTPAAVRFISFEPLIGDVGRVDLTGIDWAIVGGESGTDARPMSEEWVDNLKYECFHANVAFFFKQWGAIGADGVRRPKHENGRMYKGQEWNEMPAIVRV